MMVRNGVDATMTEGILENDYALPLHLAVHHPKVDVPVLWWRSVGNTHTGFVKETLVDEMATAAKQDPVAWRMARLDPQKHVRHRAALQLAERAKPAAPLPPPAAPREAHVGHYLIGDGRPAFERQLGYRPEWRPWLVDTIRAHARLLSYLEGGSQYNALNFSYEYNDASGGNFTGASAAVNIFVCPSSIRSGGGARDTAASARPASEGITKRGQPSSRSPCSRDSPRTTPYQGKSACGMGYSSSTLT